MKFKGLATLALATSLTISATFATPLMGDVIVKNQQKPMRNAVMVLSDERGASKAIQDPLNFFENKKNEIKQMLKEGKITQQEAEAKLARLDDKIKAIEEFNKLSVPEKKKTLINHYKMMLDKKVEAGKIAQKEADERLQSFTENVKTWDGNGYPKFVAGCHKKH